MENQMSTLNMFAECESCHKRFVLNKENVTRQEFLVKGQSIYLTYYDCSECGRRHFVQIDDEKSDHKLKTCKKHLAKLMILRRKGKDSEKQSEKFKRARQDLHDYRMKLMREFTDTTFYDKKSDSEFILKRFSI